MDKFKVIIAGSRNFKDYPLLVDTCNKLLSNISKLKEICIVSGKANGADTLGEQYAQQQGYEVISCPADWNKNGRKAGYIRNCEMADIADACIIFCIGNSRGSMHMYNICLERNIPVRLIKL